MSPVNNTSRPPATGSAPGRRPSTPQEHDLSATYSPGDGDFFGDHWAATSSNSRFRREEADSTSVSTVGSPDRRAVKPSNPLHVASASTQMMQSNSVQSSPGRGNDSGDAGRESDRDRRPRHRTVPSQRAMLAKALEKANSAVVLDNESEYQKAMDAYSEACDLLHQVMTRSGTEEDKTKLDAIRNTYRVRIVELKNSDLKSKSPTAAKDKALPEVPHSLANSVDLIPERRAQETADSVPDPTPAMKNLAPDAATTHAYLHPHSASSEHLPPRRQSLSPRSIAFNPNTDRSQNKSPERAVPVVSEHRAPSPRKHSAPNAEQPKMKPELRNLSVPMESKYAPAPLSPRRIHESMTLPPTDGPSSAASTLKASSSSNAMDSMGSASKENRTPRLGHFRTETAESTSWLDTLGAESGGSSGSSMRSGHSPDHVRNGHHRHGSGSTELEFHSAMDAAIEAAYPDSYEVDEMSDNDLADQEPLTMAHHVRSISDSKRNVERARRAVQEASREDEIARARHLERQRLHEKQWQPHTEIYGISETGLDAEDVEEEEEEERLLEQMTGDHVLDLPASFF